MGYLTEVLNSITNGIVSIIHTLGSCCMTIGMFGLIIGIITVWIGAKAKVYLTEKERGCINKMPAIGTIILIAGIMLKCVG